VAQLAARMFCVTAGAVIATTAATPDRTVRRNNSARYANSACRAPHRSHLSHEDMAAMVSCAQQRGATNRLAQMQHSST